MNVVKLLLPLVFASLAFTVNAQERSSVVQQLLPNGGDVAHTLGLDLYKFKLPVRSPQFEVILREKPTNDSEMKVIASYAFEADHGYNKEGATLILRRRCFGARGNPKGKGLPSSLKADHATSFFGRKLRQRCGLRSRHPNQYSKWRT